MCKTTLKVFACIITCAVIFYGCKKEDKQGGLPITETGEEPHLTDSFIFHSNTKEQLGIWIKDQSGNIMSLPNYKAKYAKGAQALGYCGTGQELDNTFLFYSGYFMSMLTPR